MQTSIEGPVEQDPEYQLIVEANNLAVEIDTEIGIHIFLNCSVKTKCLKSRRTFLYK